MSDRPAILGGTATFQTPLPFVKPLLPAYEAVAGSLAETFKSGMLTKGQHLMTFEKSLANYLGVPNAVGVSSCTIGLALAYQALGLSGEVVVPSFTFMATGHALVWNRVIPVFADVDPGTWTVDPDCVESRITKNTTAIVAVHTFGNPARVEDLTFLAQKYGLKLVFDAAHGFGALHRGQPLGKNGDVEVFSCSPTKLLVAGEGGVVTTADAALAEKVRLSREYGNDGAYDSLVAGLNGRMQEFSAVLGLEALRLLEENALRRNEIASLFRKRLGSLPGLGFQKIEPGDRSSFKDFVVSVEPREFGLSRDELAEALRMEGIDTRNYYDPPLHLQSAYKEYEMTSKGTLPVTESLAKKAISLPIYAQMTTSDVDKIGETVERIHRRAREISKALMSRKLDQ